MLLLNCGGLWLLFFHRYSVELCLIMLHLVDLMAHFFLFLLSSYDSFSSSLLFELQQIHALVMSLSYTGIEIKTAHSLESWNGGVLVMVSGSVQMKNFNRVRKFVQTFFLAPQEKGYFVLNDIFHFVDEEPVHHYPAVLLSQTNLDPTLNVPAAVPETGLMY